MRYLYFYVLKFRFQNLWHYTYAWLFWILSTIKMKLDKILVCCMTNISKLFLAQYWRLETSFRPFYDFFKITIYWDMGIFNIWHLPFFILPYSPFHKNKTLEYTWHNWLLTLLSNWIRFLNWKGPWTYPQSSKLFKSFLKIIALAYIYQLAKFGYLTFVFCVLTFYLLINGG